MNIGEYCSSQYIILHSLANIYIIMWSCPGCMPTCQNITVPNSTTETYTKYNKYNNASAIWYIERDNIASAIWYIERDNIASAIWYIERDNIASAIWYIARDNIYIIMWSCPGNMAKYYPGLRDILPSLSLRPG